MFILAIICAIILIALATGCEGFATAVVCIFVVSMLYIGVAANQEIIVANLIQNQDVTIDYRIPNTHTTRKYYLGITQVEEQQFVKVEK